MIMPTISLNEAIARGYEPMNIQLILFDMDKWIKTKANNGQINMIILINIIGLLQPKGVLCNTIQFNTHHFIISDYILVFCYFFRI